MHIKLATSAGFCMGVRRAVNTVLELTQKGTRPIYTLGPLVHNRHVIQLLESRGVRVISPEDIDAIDSGTVVIRAHGVTPQILDRLNSKNLTVVDATCPRVKSIQKIIRKHTSGGGSVVIVGDRGHAETISLQGFAGEKGYVIERPDEVDTLPELTNVIVVSQTTQDVDNFRATATRLTARYPGTVVKDTICDSTHRRQDETRKLASVVDRMIVVGGKDSANTRRLVEISEAAGTPTHHVESPADLKDIPFGPTETIGLTAGASTPNWMIHRILDALHQAAGSRRPAPLRWATAFIESLIRANFDTLVGAGCLTVACYRLLGKPLTGAAWMAAGCAALYVFAMHSLNRFTDPRQRLGADVVGQKLSWEGPRAAGIFGFAATAGALVMGGLLGLPTLILVAAISLAGLLYRLPVLPRSMPGVAWRGLSDIPGSKNLFVVLAWGIATVVLPRLDAVNHTQGDPVILAWGPAAAFFFVAGLVFVRSMLLDIRDIQTDRIVGAETIPMLIGKDKAKIILAMVLAAVAAVLVTGTWAGALVRPTGWWMILCVAYTFGYLYIYHRRGLMRDVVLQGATDGAMVLAAAVAWLA